MIPNLCRKKETFYKMMNPFTGGTLTFLNIKLIMMYVVIQKVKLFNI